MIERMKVEIDSEELKRLKSREEKYLAYMDMLSYRGEDKTYVDALCGKVAQLEEENKNLKDDIKKWEDKWMVRLAEIYLMPTRELTTAIAKNEWFSSWYDTVKKNMLHELGFDRLDVQDLLKENKTLKEKQKVLDKENCKLIDENVKLKKWIYQNVHGGPRIDYQEFCKKNGI